MPWLRPKRLIEILPAGAGRSSRYEQVLLNFDDLLTILENHDANVAWHRGLSAVAGIYLVVDLASGHQQIGGRP